METRKIGNLTELSSTDGYIHKSGTDTYAKSIVMLPSDTLDMYGEVAGIPPFTKGEYDGKVAELVRGRYSESEEFAIQRKAFNAAFYPSGADGAGAAALEEYADYNSYVELCKVRARAVLAGNDLAGDAPVR